MEGTSSWARRRLFSSLNARSLLRALWPSGCITPAVFVKNFRETGQQRGRKTMNSNWKNFLAIAVVVAGAGATASSQSLGVRVNVPFNFSVNDRANLPSGNYTLSQNAGVWRMTSEDYRTTVPIVNSVGIRDAGYQDFTLTFSCARVQCQLEAIHPGNGRYGVEVPAPHRSKSDREELAVVNVPAN
jgi:hypothetical protein